MKNKNYMLRGSVLLHSCCAPCSTAILDFLTKEGYKISIFFCNPNIFPIEEYEIRKSEIVKYAIKLGIDIIDGDRNEIENQETSWHSFHSNWKKAMNGLEEERERGARCLECFKYRLSITAKYASENSYDCFTTTLASSRWKDLNQINEAGFYAESLYPTTKFWDRNWKKGGLYELRNKLAKQFYNQNYCGCEYSITP